MITIIGQRAHERRYYTCSSGSKRTGYFPGPPLANSLALCLLVEAQTGTKRHVTVAFPTSAPAVVLISFKANIVLIESI